MFYLISIVDIDNFLLLTWSKFKKNDFQKTNGIFGLPRGEIMKSVFFFTYNAVF
jgi:hypothetical protein